MCTSPPYWGLRDYAAEGQLGLEKTPEEYVARMVELFREVRRVLRKDGTLWLNLGDSYATQPAGNFGKDMERRWLALEKKSLSKQKIRQMILPITRLCARYVRRVKREGFHHNSLRLIVRGKVVALRASSRGNGVGKSCVWSLVDGQVNILSLRRTLKGRIKNMTAK